MHDSPSGSIRERLIHAIGGYSTPMLWYRAFRPRWFWNLTSPYGRPTSRYVRENGLRVRRGPFAEMLFPGRALGHTNYLSSKLAGTYEPPVVEFLARHANSHELFVDLGSGDGFFCTGVARLAGITVIGYEVNQHERALSRKIASINSVEIDARDLATQTELNGLPPGKLLLLCDLEGLEEEILDPDVIPRLRDTTMVVETHEQFRPAVVSTLTERFRETHEITGIQSRPFDAGALPELASWDEESKKMAVHDGHAPGESWLTFEPRTP